MVRIGSLGLVVLVCGCAGLPTTPAPPAANAPIAAEPLFDGLGNRSHPIVTSSKEAQRYFDQGLAFLYGFNHDEAVRSFQQARELDPASAMAAWGVAIANGPHINNPVVDDAHNKAATEAITQAKALLVHASDLERALVDAASKRYSLPAPPDRTSLDAAYAEAMRGVWRAFPNDADVGAMYAEALMDLHPWDFWLPDGTPRPWTAEVVTLLEAVLAKAPHHPQANHLYIHAMEASPMVEKAAASADRLRSLQPGLGHLVHMPSHIDVRRGRWEAAVVANEKAIAADAAYARRARPPTFYSIYIAHNHEMLGYASMMEGNGARALEANRRMLAGIPAEALTDPATAAQIDGRLAGPLEVMMRFGRWDEILAEPEKPGAFPLYKALRFATRGVAFAAKGNLTAARTEQTAFVAALAAIPKDRPFGTNVAVDVALVAERLLAGESSFRAGDVEAGLAALREAVAREDALHYDEPPDWLNPTRHALGAALLKAGRAPEAERVYREDLRRLPENGWALIGLARSLKAQGRNQEATDAEARFRKAWGRADVTLSSSCFCQPGE